MNQWSEYSEAILRGIIVDLDERGVRGYQTKSGKTSGISFIE
jgi:hypothetical protein